MSKTIFPYFARDISAVARALRVGLEAKEQPLGHVQILNILARAAGFKNYQHFRAAAQAQTASPPAPAAVDQALVQRVARSFDSEGRLLRWPSKASHQTLCLWVLWSRLDVGELYTERQIGAFLNKHHQFKDHALLRRELSDQGLVSRKADGSQYRRLEKRPPPEALALIRHLKK
ncbi:MAG: DUF2087 domain-containing protein [Rhodospirillaceae bacterium]|nr:DUF2087 domain-containing protein [Rhodospirillaceae bacterium]